MRGAQRDVLVEGGVEAQHRESAERAVVVADDLTAPQSPHEVRELLELHGGGLLETHPGDLRAQSAAHTQREPSAGEPVHGGGERRGDGRMPGADVRCRGGDPDAVGRRTRGTREGACLLDVESLGDEGLPEPELLGLPQLVEHVSWLVTCPPSV